MAQDSSPNPDGYRALLDDLKRRIGGARIKASLAVNHELVLLYWSVGRDILTRQERAGWGAKVIDRLAGDLQQSFPEMKGLSPRNLRYMRDLAREWPEEAIVPQLVAKIPWGHNRALLDKVKSREEREWYIRACVEHGWSRSVLVHQIQTRLIERRGAATTNFEHTLPVADSDLAREVLKDPYTFDLLAMADGAKEREIERALLENLQRFMIELGKGFAFMGNQYRLEVGGEEFRIDLLFYHVPLHRYVVFELKTGKFKPEHLGQLKFYMTAIDNDLRGDLDGETIGVLLCQEKNRIVAEYALQDGTKPMGVAEYRVLPPELSGQLPSVDQLQEAIQTSSQGTETSEEEG